MAREALTISGSDIRLGPEGIEVVQVNEAREMLRALMKFLGEKSQEIHDLQLHVEQLQQRIAELETWRALSVWERVKSTLRRWFETVRSDG